MNKLKEQRVKYGLTQVEAAKILNISRRSYQMYEGMVNESEKLNYYIEKLSKAFILDEEHGVLTLDMIKNIVNSVLENYDVKSCYLFGSYAKGKAHEKSDVDLLIDSSVTGLRYFGLVEELREKLCKKVDLLNTKELVQNENLISEILKDVIKIYG